MTKREIRIMKAKRVDSSKDGLFYLLGTRSVPYNSKEAIADRIRQASKWTYLDKEEIEDVREARKKRIEFAKEMDAEREGRESTLSGKHIRILRGVAEIVGRDFVDEDIDIQETVEDFVDYFKFEMDAEDFDDKFKKRFLKQNLKRYAGTYFQNRVAGKHDSMIAAKKRKQERLEKVGNFDFERDEFIYGLAETLKNNWNETASYITGRIKVDQFEYEKFLKFFDRVKSKRIGGGSDVSGEKYKLIMLRSLRGANFKASEFSEKDFGICLTDFFWEEFC